VFRSIAGRHCKNKVRLNFLSAITATADQFNTASKRAQGHHRQADRFIPRGSLL